MRKELILMIPDLYEALLLLNNNDVSYTLDDLSNLAHALKLNPKKVVEQIENYTRQQAERLNLCPECFSELSTFKSYEESEFHGIPVKEIITERRCSCGWSEND
jgi:hypothetical protein